jgi:hypothetical protein
MVIHQMRVFDARGFHVSILLTGHHGLEPDMRLLADFYRRSTGTPMLIRAMGDWECINYGNYRGDHAGMCETQQLMALRPESVDLSRREPSPIAGPMAGTDFFASSTIPSGDVGEKIVDSQIRGLGIIQHDLLTSYAENEHYTPPDQNRVDELWRTFDRLTRKYWLGSSTLDEFKKRTAEAFPGWEALGL